MPGLGQSDIVSKVPSLANALLCAANPEETPLLTRIRKGKALTQMDHKYFVEVKPGRKSGGATDGQDVTTYEKGGPRRELHIRAQEFRRTPKVGQQTQEIVEDAVTKDQFARLKMELGKELMKDVEAKMLSDDESAPDEGQEDKGSRMAGIGNRLLPASGTQNDYPIPADVRIPSTQIITGSIAGITEETVEDAMEKRRNLCGASAELVLICGTKVQRKFNEFENYLPDKAGHTAVIRTTQNAQVERTLRRGIRFYEGAFGTVEIVIDDFMPNQYRGYLLDFDQMEMLPFGKMARFKPLPDLGGGPRGLLQATLAYKVGDPRAHIVFKPNESN